MHGLGVRPARNPATNSSTTSRWNSSRRSRPTCGTPSAWQAERAARTDCGEQQARSPSGAPGSIHSRSVTPTGSRPASTAFRSATARVDAARHGHGDPAGDDGGSWAESRAVGKRTVQRIDGERRRSRGCARPGAEHRLDVGHADPRRRRADRGPRPAAAASSAAAVACGQAKLRCRAAAMRPSATASSIRTWSPQVVLPASPGTAPGSARTGVTQRERVLDRGGGVHARSLDGPQPVAAIPRARPARSRSTHSLKAAAKPSTSAAVVLGPSETRTTQRPRPPTGPARPGRGSARRRRRRTPNRRRRRSPRGRARARAARRGRPAPGRAGCARQPRRAGRDDRHVAAKRRLQPGAQRAHDRRRPPGSAASAAANPTTPGTFSVPERRPCSWPPPQTSGGMRAGRRARPGSRRPWGRPACAPRAPATRRRGRRPTGKRRRGLHRVAVQRHAPLRGRRRPARSIGCTAPVTLFAHITAASRSPGRTSRANSPAIDDAVAVDRRPRDLEAAPLELAARLAHRRVLDRAHDQPPGRRAGEAEHRLVVGLGAAGGEDDLARLGVQQAGERGRGPPRAPPAPRGRRRAAPTRCRTAPTGTAPSPRGPRRRAASSPRGRGTRSYDSGDCPRVAGTVPDR